jgi:hypothetical protein
MQWNIAGEFLRKSRRSIKVKHNGFCVNYLIRGGNRAEDIMTMTLKNKKVQTNTSNLLENRANVVDLQVFGEKVGIFARLFGCTHQNLSRPFSHKSVAYRTCLQCGARKQFNTQTLETVGGFYYPPRARVDALSTV